MEVDERTIGSVASDQLSDPSCEKIENPTPDSSSIIGKNNDKEDHSSLKKSLQYQTLQKEQSFLQHIHWNNKVLFAKLLNEIEGVDSRDEDFSQHHELSKTDLLRIIGDNKIRITNESSKILLRLCEIFVLDLTFKSYQYRGSSASKCLEKQDIIRAVMKSDMLDFLCEAAEASYDITPPPPPQSNENS